MNEKLIRRAVTWVLIAGAVVIVGGLSFALWRSFSDGPRTDTSDLEPVRVAVPANENGFAVLEKIAPLVKWDGDLHMYGWSMPKKWDQAKVDALIAQNEKALALFDTAMAMPGFQCPKMEPARRWSDYLTPFQNVARVRALSAITHWNRKESHAAFDENFQVMEFGNRLENGGGGIGHFLVGISLEGLALNNFARFLPETDAAQREELKDALARLERLEDHAIPFRNVMKADFMTWDRGIDEVVAGKLRVWELMNPAGYGSKPPIPDFLFQPNTTRAMLAETVRQILRESALDYDKTDHEPGQLKTLNAMTGTELAVSQNVIGRVLYKTMAGSMVSMAVRRYRITTFYSMTRALIAVRLYWLDHGKLPATLEELVPAYLKAVPRDAFDGKPLRYSPASKVIYSVGKDLADHGGDLSEGNSEGDRQPTVKIEW